MRLVAAALAASLAVPAAAGVPGLAMAEAASPVATQPLAAGEVLLEVNAVGIVTSRADLASYTVPVATRGATEAEARRRAEAQVARIVAAARAAGVAEADIVANPVTSGANRMDSATEAAIRAMEAETGGGPSRATVLRPPAEPSASGSVEIRLRNLDRTAAFRQAIEAAAGAGVPDPSYALGDARRARDEARRQALSTARSDAESCAAALGMRVVRIVRVTDRVGLDLLGTMMGQSSEMRGLLTMAGGRSANVTTAVPVGVDFALAPR